MSGAEIQVTGVPSQVAEAIREAYDLEQGQRLAEHVLAMAEAGDERLRGYFEWDDTKAARTLRVMQAAMLVRRVKVTVLREPESPPVQVRAYIARRELTAEAENIEPGGYIAIEQVAGRTAYEASVQDSIRRDLERLRRKYDNTASLFEVAAEVFGAEV